MMGGKKPPTSWGNLEHTLGPKFSGLVKTRKITNQPLFFKEHHENSTNLGVKT